MFVTSAEEGEGGETLPGVGVPQDGGERQHHWQTLHLGHVVVD